MDSATVRRQLLAASGDIDPYHFIKLVDDLDDPDVWTEPRQHDEVWLRIGTQEYAVLKAVRRDAVKSSRVRPLYGVEFRVPEHASNGTKLIAAPLGAAIEAVRDHLRRSEPAIPCTEQMIKRSAVLEKMKISTSRLSQLIKDEGFPKPVGSLKKHEFPFTEINAWLKERDEPTITVD